MPSSRTLKTVGTHYEVLGVASTADDDRIRQSYLALARKYHPDFHEGSARASAEASMQRVNEAWSVLGNRDRRRAYDQALKFGRGATSSGTQSRSRNAEWQPYDDGPDIDPRDLDDRPVAGSKPLPRWITMAPAAGLVAAVFLLGAGTLIGSRGIVTLAVTGLALAVAMFFLVPLFALSRAERDPEL